ncbi:MAG TPA: hypothetical protein VG389_15455 [Myxococcota bacterium]|jgi:cytochrome c biogenesis protein CcdA|nr:hypothetical protein [Myxococcota bacterium]
MAERESDRGNGGDGGGGLRRFLSPKLLWKAMHLPWYVWAGVAAVGLVAVYVLFQKLIVYAVLVAVVFFGSKMIVDFVKGRKERKEKAAAAAAAAAASEGVDWKKELGF